MEAPILDQKWFMVNSKLSLAYDKCSHLVHHARPFFKVWKLEAKFDLLVYFLSQYRSIALDHSATEPHPQPKSNSM